MNFLLQSGLKRRWLIALALGTLGLALNRTGLPIFGSAEIFFGGWATLLAVYWLGPWWGAAATALAFSLTWLTHGQPWMLICYVLEAVVVGWLKHRRQVNPLVAALAYWLGAGVPLAALAVVHSGSLPFPDNWAFVVKLPVNSLLMAFAVLPVFYARSFRARAGLPLDREADTPLQRVLFRRLGIIITFSMASLSLFAGRVLDESLRNYTKDELVTDSRELADLLERYLEKHRQAIALLAGNNRVTTVANYSLTPQLANLRTVYPAFITALAADADGRIVAATPSTGRGERVRNLSVADREYFQSPLATSQPFVSNVFRGRGFGQDLIVAISAPLLTPARRPIGIVEGSLNVGQLISDLGHSGQLDERAVLILDHADQVVASQGALHLSALSGFRHHPLHRAAENAAGLAFAFDLDVDGSTERYIATRHVVRGYDWEIIIAEPVWRTQRITAGYYLFTLLGAVLATGLALWLARGTAREITEPLNDLVHAIHRLSLAGDETVPDHPIEPVSRELTELARELHTAALTLTRSNRELAATIADRDQTQENLRGLLLHLEDLVRERTAELDVARQAAESASQAKTEFLASMSHELRTPLNVIVGMSELMAEQTLGPLTPRQTEGLQNVNESGRHLLELINDILDLSKIEAGQLQLDFQPMEIAAVCATSVRFVREAARRKEIRVETNVAPDLAPVLADERRVKQILVNLLANAVKFTPAGGRVGLDARIDAAAGQVRFEVWDTGIGIASANFERIFQPFQQIDSSLSRQYSGTGLGLALVRRMAGLHGGSVEVQSETGRGSRFIILLPWQKEAAAPAPAAPTVDSAFPFSADPLHILIAEDNAANRQVYAAYFSTRPCRVTYATHGREAIELALALHPDLVLMDVHMPVMDGLEATRLLRADPRTAALPIVTVTALAMPEDRLRCLEAGANAYLAKPINLRELSRTIARFTPAHRALLPEPVSPP